MRQALPCSPGHTSQFTSAAAAIATETKHKGKAMVDAFAHRILTEARPQLCGDGVQALLEVLSFHESNDEKEKGIHGGCKHKLRNQAAAKETQREGSAVRIGQQEGNGACCSSVRYLVRGNFLGNVNAAIAFEHNIQPIVPAMGNDRKPRAPHHLKADKPWHTTVKRSSERLSKGGPAIPCALCGQN